MIIPAILVVILIVLVLLLRAVVAPLLLVGTVVLSFLATMGVCALVFDHVFGFAGADPSFPLFAFVFLVALGIDYNIFLMTRVREEAQVHGTRRGDLKGLAVTGGVITSAGVVLAATFSALGVLPLVPFAELGFAVAFGVLLDTLIVRSLLVPALVDELDDKVWWPFGLPRRSAGDRPWSPGGADDTRSSRAAGPAVEPEVDDHVVPRATVDEVREAVVVVLIGSSPCPRRPVGTVLDADGVVAAPRDDQVGVVGRPVEGRRDEVGDGVLTPPAEDPVVARAAGERVVRGAAEQCVRAAPSEDRVPTGAAGQGVVATSAVEVVGPGAALEQVVAASSPDPVALRSAGQLVLAWSAPEPVAAGPAGHEVVARQRPHDVVTATRRHGVQSRRPDQDVRPARAVDHVGHGGSCGEQEGRDGQGSDEPGAHGGPRSCVVCDHCRRSSRPRQVKSRRV